MSSEIYKPLSEEEERDQRLSAAYCGETLLCRLFATIDIERKRRKAAEAYAFELERTAGTTLDETDRENHLIAHRALTEAQDEMEGSS